MNPREGEANLLRTDPAQGGAERAPDGRLELH